MHPGEVLREEYLVHDVLLRTQRAILDAGMTPETLLGICTRQEPVTTEAATQLAVALGTTPDFWTNLQAAYDREGASSPVRMTESQLEHYRCETCGCLPPYVVLVDRDGAERAMSFRDVGQSAIVRPTNDGRYETFVRATTGRRDGRFRYSETTSPRR